MSTKAIKEKNVVLIVDDDEFLLEMYALKFKEEGFGVEIAESGREALEKMDAIKPDIVLLDVVLPEIDGFAVLQKMRDQKKTDMPLVIMLTNLGQKDDTERGMRLGADDYVVKAHFTPSEVVEKVKKLLAKRR
ncbi:MAG: putative OmpR family two-component system response regulator [Parcubacteria group bacterium Gr01-1014_70]|nr:MAG: putative OmpR family two-component system response regulator [Parcubacteria group bacterium Gr01-1014_70]